jgi:hypothetical protein
MNVLATGHEQLVEAIARRVVELLDERAAAGPDPARLTDAGGLARLLDVSRAFVYEHQDELGAVRVGSLLRFPVPRVEVQGVVATSRRSGQRSQQAETGGEQPERRPHRRRRAAATRDHDGLLPVIGSVPDGG